MNTRLTSAITIAKKHAERLQYAITKIAHKFPISVEQLVILTNEEIETFELFTSRFAKLQDFIGTKLYPLFLELSGEEPQKMTFIDLLNKLEKLGIIDSAEEWKLMRNARNHISHEYPENPELMAVNMNIAYEFSPKLINYLNKIIIACEKIN